MSPSLAELSNRLTGIEKLRRLGQALWMMLEKRVARPDFIWARGLMGEGGDEILWSALLAEGLLAPPDYCVHPSTLARMLGRLADGTSPTTELPRLVWTLPTELGLPDIETTYSEAAISLVDSAMKTLSLVSPFMEAKGVGKLLDSLLRALKRGVNVSIFTHAADDVSSYASTALDEVRREAEGLSGHLSVYSARTDLPLLLHSKLVVSDAARAIVGSANVTARGFGENLEAGVVLGERQTAEIAAVVDALRRSGLVAEAF